MKTGYFMLGECKGLAYIYVSLAFALLFIVLLNKKLFKKGRLPAPLSYGLGAFLFSNILSFIFSVDKKISFFGLDGWRSGLLFVLLLLFFFYVFYEEDRINGYVLAAVLITPFLEGLLGVLHRFDVYPFEIYGTDPAFLATLGNINWFVAYFSVFVPLGIGLCYTRKLLSKEFFLLAIYVYVTLLAIFLQGSDSGALVIVASYVVLLFIALGSREGFRSFLALVFILGLSMESGALLYMGFSDFYYYQENFLLSLCLSHVGAIIIGVVLFIACVSRLLEAIGVRFREKTYRCVAAVLAVIGVVVAFVFAVSSFDLEAGNGRGLIYSLSLDIFARMDPLRKLVGCGQECFSAYAYMEPEAADSLLNIFEGNILTNAHSAPLTILIERGLLGLFSYILLIALFVKEIFAQKNKHAGSICALILSSYLINSFVSFDLVISTPYLFLALAICLSYKEIRK